jgi:hypothetical protein
MMNDLILKTKEELKLRKQELISSSSKGQQQAGSLPVEKKKTKEKKDQTLRGKMVVVYEGDAAMERNW